MSTTVRISASTHRRLAAIAETTGRRMQAILEEAVAAYEADTFWNSLDAGYARLANDAADWAAVEEERTGEAPALADDIDGA